MMTQLQMLQMFWDDWGNHNLDFYKVYVQCGIISKEDYKTVTGQDYEVQENNKYDSKLDKQLTPHFSK